MKGSRPGERRGGRKKGVPNKVSAATREWLLTDVDPLGFLARVMRGEPIERCPLDEGEAPVRILPTLDQSISAANTLARKMCPDAKERCIQIKLPPLEKPADAVTALSAISQAVAGGTITPSEGHTLAGIVEIHRRTVEMLELEAMLAALGDKG